MHYKGPFQIDDVTAWASKMTTPGGLHHWQNQPLRMWHLHSHWYSLWYSMGLGSGEKPLNNAPIWVWEGYSLTFLSLSPPSSEPKRDPHLESIKREAQKSERYWWEPILKTGDWDLLIVGLATLRPDVSRLAHPQSADVRNNHRLPLEARSKAEHNLYFLSTALSKDPWERKKLNIVNLVSPNASAEVFHMETWSWKTDSQIFPNLKV